MKNRVRYPWLLSLLIILTLCFIWGNSLLPATVSAGFSGWVRRLLNSLFGLAGGSGALIGGDGILRKIAHSAEFACLGAELVFWRERRRTLRLRDLFLWGLMVALADETIQLFVAGRAGLVQAIWIDLAGYAAGCGLSLLFLGLRAGKCVPER